MTNTKELDQKYICGIQQIGVGVKNFHEGWKWYIPHASVIFPGRFGRITEEYLTNSDNALLNFSVAMLNDPINFFPVNALTKVGEAKNLIKALSFIDDTRAVKLATKAAKGIKNTKSAQKFYEGLHVERLIEPIMRQEAITDWLRKSDSLEMVTKKLRSLGATNKDIKKMKPLYKMIDESPEGIDGMLKSSWWNSEALMNQERTLIGFDPLMGGWTGKSRWGMPRAVNTEAGKLLGKMENWWTKVNKGAKIRQMTKEATLWERSTRAVPEAETTELQGKINKLSRDMFDNLRQRDEAEVKLNYWKSKRNRNQAISHAEDIGQKSIDDLKTARNAELDKINNELQTFARCTAGCRRPKHALVNGLNNTN